MRTFLAMLRDESGTTSIEYAVIGTLASILIAGGVTAIGTKLNGYFVKVSGNLN